MARFSIYSFVTSVLATISTVFGCGTMPAGQEKTVNFTVTGFTLPVAMVHSRNPGVLAKVPGIAPSKKEAQAFVQRLVMQTVLDVLENQGRSALLPDAVIQTILDQMNVTIRYQPMSCPRVIILGENARVRNKISCIIASNTVTAICPAMARECEAGRNVAEVPSKHLSISGTLSTTNIIMANWSKAMWQNVVNRANRMLATGPFGLNFYSAFATISGI
ncbi:hypothetical protein KIN20_011866 [Parelaphostrongylus tenuis]|uniref:Uncharacterized protein n=1 Tax=Parelaphostrongylus tenuis TaxID=148309 RepID=A0AAD5MBF1_PARTN|nr:hypothetical protein KIN20_011866 [Parelaphostrongylus tenuis]